MSETAPVDRDAAIPVPIVRPRKRLPRAVRTVLALLLYALLIDAAVETYQSTSPVSLWVAVPVGLYVSFTFWLLRQHSASRPGLASTVWLSAFIFLGVLAYTATMPDGTSNGMRVATLPTQTVLSLATAAVLLLAIVSLTVDLPLPIPVRAVAGLLACYGLAAFVTGVAWQRTYVQLLQGASFWERLPYWLQGAFVGALVVLPFAFLMEVGVALARVKVKGRMHRIVAFALGVMMAYAAFTVTK